MTHRSLWLLLLAVASSLAACSSDPAPRDVAAAAPTAPSSAPLWTEAPLHAPTSAEAAPRETAAPSVVPVSSNPLADLPVAGPVEITDGKVPDVVVVVKRMSAGFRACHNSGRKENPDMQGSLRLTLVIGTAGDVLSARATATDGSLSAGLVGCIEARAAAAQFSWRYSGTATITIPLSFAPFTPPIK